MVSHQYQCIHVHIPKTAGQSIRAFLNPGASNAEAFPSDYANSGPRAAHLTVSEMMANDLDGLCKKYFKFAFIRNPWDRAVSEYLWRQKRKTDRVAFDTFESFLMGALEGWEYRGDDVRHMMSQKAFVTSESGNLLVDFIGRFENFNVDMAEVCQCIGVSFQDFPRINESNKVARSNAFYTPETRELVHRLWGEDIDYFEYDFPAL